MAENRRIEVLSFDSPAAQKTRRRPESNRRVEVLQTSALPLGYAAMRSLGAGLAQDAERSRSTAPRLTTWLRRQKPAARCAMRTVHVNPAPRLHSRGFRQDASRLRHLPPRVHTRGFLWYGVKTALPRSTPKRECASRIRAACGKPRRDYNSPSDWKSTCPPTRRILTPSGWLPSLSSASGSVDRLAGDRPVR